MNINSFDYNINDIITTDGYLSFCNKNNLQYIKTDYFYNGNRIFNWRGKLHPQNLPISTNMCVIGHSDYPVTNSISNNFKYVFCINRYTNNENTFGIPLGICNDVDSELHKICGDKNLIIKIYNDKTKKENLAYINFTISTNKNERKLVFDLFSNKKWVKVGKMVTTSEGMEEYLIEIKYSKFVFCPSGNGIDTHRIWEAIYMGSIPIVKYENTTHHLFTDLPILFIDNWNQINEIFLNKEYEKIINKDYNMEKLKLSYWENFIIYNIK